MTTYHVRNRKELLETLKKCKKGDIIYDDDGVLFTPRCSADVEKEGKT